MVRGHLWLASSVLCLLSTFAVAEAPPTPSRQADALLSIDQYRATVIDRIVRDWGDQLAASSAALKPDQLRTMLDGLRADQLLAASLAGTLDGLRNVLAVAVTSMAPLRDGFIETKALGDSTDDLVYTPVTPCRLVDTRPGTFAAVYQGAGAFAPNAIRNYALQGANGVCLAQLPAGLNPSAVQLQVFGIPVGGANGDIEILPQGSTFGSTTTEVFLGTELITSAATTARINLANNQIGVQVRGGSANLAIDVVGYFKSPGGAYFAQGGNAFGTIAKLGTLDNQPLEVYVNNQRTMRYEPNATSPNVIGGYVNNGVYGGVVGATVAGGGAAGAQNTLLLSGDICDLVYGCLNGVTDAYGTVGGGAGNLAGDGVGTLTDQPFATVAGGLSNWALAEFSAVGGGYKNAASAEGAAVAGGYLNTASGERSVVTGGSENTASGVASAVLGGLQNYAYGTQSVAMGTGSRASGDFSVAMGHHAQANSDGCLVFGDSSTSNEVRCDAPNRIVLRGAGGIFMFTGGSDQPSYTGVVLPPGAQAWIAASDRAGKENLAAVDVRAVLDRVIAMPVSTWNWKSQDPAIRHMGPMAQDFRGAFGLGETEKGISTIDADGVAFAAIQGLHQLVQDKDTRIDALEKEIETERQMLRSQQSELTQLRQTVEALLAKMGGDATVAVAH